MYPINFKTICDELIASGEIDPVIIVSPNAYNKYHGSWYINSLTTGNWKDYITRDVVQYMDLNFRTIPQKESRGIAGHSMGGYGSMWLAMNNPNIYSAVYALTCPPELEILLGDWMIEASEAISLEELDSSLMMYIAAPAAFSPDTSALPFYCQFPIDTLGNVVDSVWQKWLKSEPFAMLPLLKDSLLKLKAIQFDVGINDYSVLLSNNRNFSKALNELSIPHVFEEYIGDHTNQLAERIETKLLPFFSANLSTWIVSDPERTKHLDVEIYPNPVGHDIHIRLPDPGHWNLSIHSLSGQVFSMYELEGPTIQLDLSTFQKGVYFITVWSSDQVWTEKIIKL